MKLNDKDFITEEEKEILRKEAIDKEFTRLTKHLRSKSRIITFYRIALATIIIGGSIWYYNNRLQHEKPQQSLLNKKHTIQTDTMVPLETKDIQVAKPPIYFTVFFLNESKHALAQFESNEKASKFCEIMGKIDLPATIIVNESIKRSKDNLQTQIYPYKYTVQLGAYNYDFLKEFKDHFIWLSYQQQDEYHKYRIGPFYGYSKSKQFTGAINLQDNYILAF
ncbi:hypothetical protein [Marinifilum flexuosum]|uniref:Uncharacterized protein n=1 Tax=Marinifilum flexuosum TaxID=1117708 RepID=A0A419WSU4_9BACT|nr:hypothetical protein [Marinifilum flexuosum]RKD98543.1 hypothetical protein BXY64_3402 [Marinifilum flexuosum]